MRLRSKDPAADHRKLIHARLVWFIIIVAFLAALSLAIIHRGDRISGLRDDAAAYAGLAENLLRKHSFELHSRSELFWVPGYPAFLALIFLVAGRSALAVYAVQAALLAATLFLVYKIALHVTQNEAASLLALALCALWYPFYKSVPTVLTETLGGFLTAAAMWRLLLAIKRPRPWTCLAAGALLALAAFTKALIVFYVVVAVIMVALSSKDRIRAIRVAVLIGIGAAVLLAPWTVRNYAVSGKFVPVSTAGPPNFWLGNNPRNYEVLPRHLHLGKMLANVPPAEMERYYYRQGWTFIREDPLRATKIFWMKFAELWLGRLGGPLCHYDEPQPTIGSFAIPRLAMLSVPLFLLAILGWVVSPRPDKVRAYPILALLILWTTGYVALISQTRYVLPVQFYEIVFAAVGARWLVHALLSRTRLSSS